MIHREDLALAARCLRDEAGAWETLLRQATPRLGAAALRILQRYGLPSGAGEAADLVQETLAELLARNRAALAAYTGRSSLDGYLAAIAAHRAARKAAERRLLPLEEGAAPPARQPSPSEALDLLERDLRLREALARLPPRDRLVLQLRLDGASAAETARVLGVSGAHAGVILSRARARAREFLKKIGEGP